MAVEQHRLRADLRAQQVESEQTIRTLREESSRTAAQVRARLAESAHTVRVSAWHQGRGHLRLYYYYYYHLPTSRTPCTLCVCGAHHGD